LKNISIGILGIVALFSVIILGVFFMNSQGGSDNVEFVHAEIPEEAVIVAEEESLPVSVDEYEIEEFIPIFSSEPLPEYIIEYINGLSYKEDTMLQYSELVYLTITHVDFYGENRIGNMIVVAEIGEEVLEIFWEIYESGFPIRSIQLIDDFNADDDLSMEANNSSAFNWRYVADTTTLSNHSFGRAIDINPVQNPYVRGNSVLPAGGEEYLDRLDIRPGMIVEGDAVYNAFVSRGWMWGGDWISLKDYQHFQKS
jgi:hypothetical protein